MIKAKEKAMPKHREIKIPRQTGGISFSGKTLNITGYARSAF